MSGEWSGGIANRTWQRAGNRNRKVDGDARRGQRLYALLKDERFWCDNCGNVHALREHRECRAAYPYRTAFRGAA